MQNAKIKHNLIVFSGNNVGFISCGTATVDTMFHSRELEAWLVEKNLNVVWKEGVYLRLVDSSGSYSDEKSGGIMAVRIWRLKPDFPMEARFMFLEDLQVRFGEPIMDNYQAIFTEEMGTENLDTIYSHLSQRTPDFLPGFGYPLSVSDVIELFDKEQREFYFIDRYRFEKIPFIPN